MAYHETFWLAVTATAPVIALATTVSFSDILRLIDADRKANKLPSSKPEPGTWPVLWSSLLSIMNMIFQLTFLFYALSSIAKGTDRTGNLGFIIWGEPIGIALLLVVAIINAVARIKVRKTKATEENTATVDADP